MRVSTALGAGCLGVLIFLVMSSKTGGLTFEGGVSKPIELGGTMTKPPEPPKQPAYSSTEDQSATVSCPSVVVQLPSDVAIVIIGESPALIIDTEGKSSFTSTDCVDLNKAPIALCDNKNKCVEGTFANGRIQAKPST